MRGGTGPARIAAPRWRGANATRAGRTRFLRALSKALPVVSIGTIVDNLMFFTAVTLTLRFA
jgi:hypothetical protein